jgi:long-chain acyl-CoA synthetase
MTNTKNSAINSFANARAAAAVGMSIAFTAQKAPDRPAILSERGDRSFGELNAQANRLVRELRAAGLRAGDAIALMCSNRPEFAEVFAGCLRGGFRLTLLNWHLTQDEVGYIVDDCEARAFIVEARCVEAPQAVANNGRLVSRIAIGSAPDFDDRQFLNYESRLSRHSESDLDDPVRGSTMLYTSGTTGRPKGVRRNPMTRPPEQSDTDIAGSFQRGESLVLCTGPLYHAAPLQTNLYLPLLRGVGVVLMDKWDAEETLALVERHRITHTHMVATMFHRLLALPEDVRNRYDVSSLAFVIHGAAPTPIHVKRAMLDWFGPVIYEYYAATEGGGTSITPEQWLRKPGSVGPPNPGRAVVVLDDEYKSLPPGTTGTVYFTTPDEGAFEYFKSPEKTAASFSGDLFTLGDHGYLDEDGYLFLTGRTSELIIAGGVNIYPAEIDAALLMHSAVADVACVGVPNDERGEEVKAVVQVAEGFAESVELAGELIEFCRTHLAKFKCPRSVDFDPKLPRSDAGKVQRRVVRDRYW